MTDWLRAFEFLVLLLVNIAVGAIGFVPSVLLTPINLDRFGLAGGSALTFLGEIFGALGGFYLYRFGASRIPPRFREHRLFRRIHSVDSRQVFGSVLLLRLVPFVPSGLVTASAALTRIRAGSFFIASTLGKIPAVAIEIALAFGLALWLPRSVLYGLVLAGVLFATIVYWQKRRALKTQKT